MTPTEQFLTAALTVTWGGLGLMFALGKWARSRETADILPLYRLTQLETRMDHAGDKMSELVAIVQVLPDKMTAEFVTRREWALTERRREGKE